MLKQMWLLNYYHDHPRIANVMWYMASDKVFAILYLILFITWLLVIFYSNGCQSTFGVDVLQGNKSSLEAYRISPTHRLWSSEGQVNSIPSL